MSVVIAVDTHVSEFFDMENLPKSEILLQICNEIMHGNYIIPSAIGFSTPLHILGDLKKAKLIFKFTLFAFYNDQI